MLLKDASSISLDENVSVMDALVQLTKTQKKVLICLTTDGYFSGVIADGDIRRSFIKGVSLETKVRDVMVSDPVFVSSQVTPSEAARLLSQKIPVLPVINIDNTVKGYYSLSDISAAIDIKGRNITILGLGYVGLTLGLVMADNGFQVTGVDTNYSLISCLNTKQAPFFEVGLQRYLNTYGGTSFLFKSEIEEAVADIYIVTVGTPLLADGSKAPNIDHVLNAASTLAKVLKQGDLVILRSTLPVGCSRNYVIRLLEEKTELVCGRDFYLAFVPERTAEGRALMELRQNPQIIGGFDSYSTELASRLFNEVTNTIIDVGTIETAELCKLVDNSFRDHIFAFSNYLAELTEKLGMDASMIVDAVNYGYKRNMIPKPSPGVGGPCLSKDPYILAGVMKDNDIDDELIKVTRDVNERGPKRLVTKLELLLEEAGKNKSDCRICVVGLGFKGEPETSDLRDSTSLWFLRELQGYKQVCGYDPVINSIEIQGLGLTPVSLDQVFSGSDAVVILNNHRSYQNWDLDSMVKTANSKLVIIDAWHIFDPSYLKRIGNVLVGGIGND